MLLGVRREPVFRITDQTKSICWWKVYSTAWIRIWTQNRIPRNNFRIKIIFLLLISQVFNEEKTCQLPKMEMHGHHPHLLRSEKVLCWLKFSGFQKKTTLINVVSSYTHQMNTIMMINIINSSGDNLFKSRCRAITIN